MRPLYLSFRGAAATRNLKDPSLCSGHGFLPAVEMTEKFKFKDSIMYTHARLKIQYCQGGISQIIYDEANEIRYSFQSDSGSIHDQGVSFKK